MMKAAIVGGKCRTILDRDRNKLTQAAIKMSVGSTIRKIYLVIINKDKKDLAAVPEAPHLHIHTVLEDHP